MELPRLVVPGERCLHVPPAAGTAPSPRDSGSGQPGDAMEQEPSKGRALDLACSPHTVTEMQAVPWCLQGAELAAASAEQPPAGSHWSFTIPSRCKTKLGKGLVLGCCRGHAPSFLGLQPQNPT